MSWQVASFVLVLAALGLACWWYERSQPPAKLVAIVATLAALAALGRDAFAAVPDVKPITAIVLVSGLAFGAAPGFAVGAVSGLASNLLLGEGPWTPWQMLGWGLVGLIGAALGRLTARRVGPLVLALACAVSAEVFNLVVDLYTWTGTGNHTLTAFGLVLGTAVVFDLTHVLASFAFGLAFGSVLLRMLERVRMRLAVQWEPSPDPPPAASGASQSGSSPGPLAALSLLALALAAGLLALGPPPRAHAAGASAPPASAAAATAAPVGKAVAAAPVGKAVAATVGKAVAAAPAPAPASASVSRLDFAREVSFLASAQNNDGGFGGARGQSSSELYSAWAAIGLAAAGRDPLSLRRGGHTVLDAIRGQAATLAGTGDLERTILALRACGVSVHSLPGGDPVARLLHGRARDGSFGELSNLTAFAVLALRAAGYPASSPFVGEAARWLARQQDSDGGFGFATRGGGSDVDDTSAVLQALGAAGTRRGQGVSRALAFLLRSQNLDGGYPQQPGGQSNSQSSAWAVQALTAAGRDAETVTRLGSRSPLGYLESLLEANGSERYSRTGSQTPVWVTAQALTALARKPFPIAPANARASAVPSSAVPGDALPSSAALPSTVAVPSTVTAPPAAGLGPGEARGLALLARVLGAALAPVLAGLSGAL